MFVLKGLNDVVKSPDKSTHSFRLLLSSTSAVKRFSVYASNSFNYGFIFPRRIRVKPGIVLKVKDNTLLLNREIQ